MESHGKKSPHSDNVQFLSEPSPAPDPEMLPDTDPSPADPLPELALPLAGAELAPADDEAFIPGDELEPSLNEESVLEDPERPPSDVQFPETS
jgi:hypothetical protein